MNFPALCRIGFPKFTFLFISIDYLTPRVAGALTYTWP